MDIIVGTIESCVVNTFEGDEAICKALVEYIRINHAH